jgi:hypothetical protein
MIMGFLGKFFDWYERHMVKSLIVSAVILYMQIPHSWWALECIFGEGILHGHGFVVDFFLYGIDTLEMIPIISITLLIVTKARKYGRRT